VPGARAVRELIEGAPGRVKYVLVDAKRDFGEVTRAAADAGIEVRTAERGKLDEVAGPGLARGIVAVADSPLVPDIGDLLDLAGDGGRRLPSGKRVIVALDGVEDPQNLGACVRSAEFFGASGVFWARDRAAGLTPAAVRASAGASERLPLCCVTNLARALETCRAADYWSVGTVVEGGQSLGTADLPDAIVLVLGSEGRGLRRLTQERCDFLVTVDGAGEVGSLNVAAAGAVALALLAQQA
jgi:23S rRNA (guanosine2251-2'-O)-methyltransferase